MASGDSSWCSRQTSLNPGSSYCNRTSCIKIASQSFEIGSQFSSSLAANVAILLQRFLDDLLQLRRHQRIQPRRRNWIAIKNRFKNDGIAGTGKCLSTHCHFIKDKSKGKEICARIQILRLCLFGGHVGHCSYRHAGTGQTLQRRFRLQSGNFRRMLLLSYKLGQPEIHNLCLATFRDENVCRFDVAMNDSLCVSRIQSVRNLNSNIEQLLDLKRLASDSVLQRLSIQEFHHNEVGRRTFVNTSHIDIVNGANVWMTQSGGSSGFALEALKSQWIFGKLGRQKF